MIQIDHVTFSYGEETEHTGGIRDIELQIKRGEFAVLCGESGCGKTTITRLINGLIPHYYEGKMSGGVWVNGADGENRGQRVPKPAFPVFQCRYNQRDHLWL